MTASVRFEPPLEEVIYDLRDAILSASKVDRHIWFEVEKFILERQDELWDEIATVPQAEATIEKAAYMARRGKKAPVDKGGSLKKSVRYVGVGGHLTGFLDERLTSPGRQEPFNLPMLDVSGNTTRFTFGIDTDAFWRQYPARLANWLEGKVKGGTIANLINLDNAAMEQLSMFLWDRIWESMEARLRS